MFDDEAMPFQLVSLIRYQLPQGFGFCYARKLQAKLSIVNQAQDLGLLACFAKARLVVCS